ncbi:MULTISPECIES: ribose-5-phosphate isomerase RpiA [Methylovorus]|jgi:ribose 5-phosphate isomerase A|uniref:Ribose-5-phosphate isomerase A n=1 Tax=Methylovorus glucosotrophus (strain SIP3-4) TaxID=582744 RepID=C6XCW0_METGS|nr:MULTISPECIES: ribose-5-phosphate isomerase RpiA [Methylovorus]ACT50385.1 ribose 5-phosphate isomerase [Methylovorus glucosotrophus SIP3-4]ADQ84365.1 ribose 5-phosphate isomerase [Methylovorus sp. MP688]KAF0844215.1 ribose-5-phosphate isomerase [Methylovorus glucosotrophus]
MNDKQLVAEHAASLVEDSMIVGLGTGSTANYFIEALSRRQRDEGLRITTVASSTISAIKAAEHGLPLLDISQLGHLDLYVDGADEITPGLTLLKGRGQDLVMEKLLARAAERFVVVADKSKQVSRIGEKFVIPVEVMPAAWKIVRHALEKANGEAELRLNASKDNVAVTAHGSYVLDVRFPDWLDDAELDILLNNTPGVVEHGVFRGLASLVLIADQGQVDVVHA